MFVTNKGLVFIAITFVVLIFFSEYYLQISEKLLQVTTTLIALRNGSNSASDKYWECPNKSTAKEDNESLANKLVQVNATQNITLYVTAKLLRAGRLGNQMFRYASLLGIARAQGRQFVVDAAGSELQDAFKLQHVAVDFTAKEWPTIEESYVFTFDLKLMKLPMKNVSIYGYLRNRLYFDDNLDEVRQEFTFHDSIANTAANILRDVYLKTNATMAVGVHVRRGDFLNEGMERMGFRVPRKSYFIKAFDWMKSKFPGRNITFIVASNDLGWCKENLIGKNVVVLPDASPPVHMAVLSMCEHAIISGGTFGWWSGWLTNGCVIYFTEYMAPDTVNGKGFIQKEQYPRLWVGLGN